MPENLNDSNAEELAQTAHETGALVLRGWLRYPGPESGDWQVGDEVLGEFLYPFRDRQVVLILAPISGEPVHLCGICGFVLERPGQGCPRCALANEEAGAILEDRREVLADVEEWLADQGARPHPLEVELGKLQAALGAMEQCPPLWWPERLLWRGLRWFYRMRRRRMREALAASISTSDEAKGT